MSLTATEPQLFRGGFYLVKTMSKGHARVVMPFTLEQKIQNFQMEFYGFNAEEGLTHGK